MVGSDLRKFFVVQIRTSKFIRLGSSQLVRLPLSSRTINLTISPRLITDQEEEIIIPSLGILRNLACGFGEGVSSPLSEKIGLMIELLALKIISKTEDILLQVRSAFFSSYEVEGLMSEVGDILLGESSYGGNRIEGTHLSSNYS